MENGRWWYTLNATGNCCIDAKMWSLVPHVEVLQSIKLCVKWLWFVSLFSFFFTGAIKSCVLIKNILSPYEMQEMSYALREHCMVLNGGSGDNVSSIDIICGFGLYKKYYVLLLFYIHSPTKFNSITSPCIYLLWLNATGSTTFCKCLQ